MEQKEDIGALIEKAVGAAVAKVLGQEEEPEEEPTMGEMIEKAVADAMKPYLEQAGVSKQINGEGIKKSEDEEEHYLHGII